MTFVNLGYCDNSEAVGCSAAPGLPLRPFNTTHCAGLNYATDGSVTWVFGNYSSEAEVPAVVIAVLDMDGGMVAHNAGGDRCVEIVPRVGGGYAIKAHLSHEDHGCNFGMYQIVAFNRSTRARLGGWLLSKSAEALK